MHDDITSCGFTARGFRRRELERLVEVLAAMGLDVECELSSGGGSAEVRVSNLPSAHEARVRRTRNAGRPSRRADVPDGSIFNNETTCEEFLAWQGSHSAAEGMEQLGLPRSTYFRRLANMREAVEWERSHNPARIRDGLPELHFTLGSLPVKVS